MHHHHIVHAVGFTAFFILGITTSLHCIGMCAPITSILFQNPKNTILFLYYHLGRIVCYALLGLLFGFVGSSMQSIIPFPYIFSLICIIFLAYIFEIRLPAPQWIQKTQSIFLRFLPKKGWKRFIVFGFFTPILPCAPLYLAFSATVATPTPLYSCLWMIAFGLGTVPLLFTAQTSLILLSKTFFAKHQKLFFKIVSIITLGFVGWMVLFMHHSMN